MRDYAALKTALETDARYDAAVRSGANSTLTGLLNEEDGEAAWVYEDAPVDDVLEAAGAARLKALTADERERLRVLRRSDDRVATSKPGIRAELLDVFGITDAQLAAAIPAVRRRPTFGEAFGYRVVSIDVVREAVRLISKSFIVTTGQA